MVSWWKQEVDKDYRIGFYLEERGGTVFPRWIRQVGTTRVLTLSFTTVKTRNEVLGSSFRFFEDGCDRTSSSNRRFQKSNDQEDQSLKGQINILKMYMVLCFQKGERFSNQHLKQNCRVYNNSRSCWNETEWNVALPIGKDDLSNESAVAVAYQSRFFRSIRSRNVC